jgi:hypothetical protein
MSKDKHDPAEDLNLDFTSFDLDGPVPDGDPDPFALEEMPGPAVAPKASKPAVSARDHFGDIDGSGADDADSAPAEESIDFGGFGQDDFGIPEEDEPAPAAPVRAARPNLAKAEPPRRAEPARRIEPAFEDGFDPAGGFGEDEAEEAPAHRLGAYDDDAPHDDGRGDGFGSEEGSEDGDEAEEGDDEPAAGKRFGFDPKKLVFPAATAAVVILGGLASWSYIGDIISPKEPVRAGGALTQVEGPGRTRQATAGVPDIGRGAAPPAQAVLPPMPQQPNRVASGSPALPSAMPQATPPAPSGRPAVASENVGPSMASAVAARPDPALGERLQRLEERLTQVSSQAGVEELQRKVSMLEERLAAAETRDVPMAPRPDVTVPLKPQLIPGYTLQGYFKGTAWIQTPQGGTVEAKLGTDLGTAGTVTGVARYAKEFVVTTTVGVIMRN